jgi:hypothetical protein
MQYFGWKTMKGRDNLEDNIRKNLMIIGWVDVDWIHVAQDKNQWQVPVNAVMKLQVPCKMRIFLTI